MSSSRRHVSSSFSSAIVSDPFAAAPTLNRSLCPPTPDRLRTYPVPPLFGDPTPPPHPPAPARLSISDRGVSSTICVCGGKLPLPSNLSKLCTAVSIRIDPSSTPNVSNAPMPPSSVAKESTWGIGTVGVLALAMAAAARYSAVIDIEYLPASCDDASGR